MVDSNMSHPMYGLNSSSHFQTHPPMQPAFYSPSPSLVQDYNKYYYPNGTDFDHPIRTYHPNELGNPIPVDHNLDGQTPPNAKVLEDTLNVHAYSARPSAPLAMNPTPTYVYPPTRHRSISSSMRDQESSNSTFASSPYSANPTGEESQNVPSTGKRSGDEGTDDVSRREKKRERNRQAAQKCRTRKLTRIAELQKRVNELQGKNRDLSSLASTLKTEVSKLERQLDDHRTRGCTLLSNGFLVSR